MPLTDYIVDSEKLIELVRQNEELYNWQNPKYMDSIRREEIWENLAKILEIPGVRVKQKWLSLRTCFTRALRQEEDVKRRKKPPKRRLWRYQNQMMWLKPFLQMKYNVPDDAEELYASELNMSEYSNEFENSNNENNSDESTPFTFVEMPNFEGGNVEDESIQIKLEIEDPQLFTQHFEPITDIVEKIPSTSKKKKEKYRKRNRVAEDDDDEGITEIMIPNFWAKTPRKEIKNEVEDINKCQQNEKETNQTKNKPTSSEIKQSNTNMSEPDKSCQPLNNISTSIPDTSYQHTNTFKNSLKPNPTKTPENLNNQNKTNISNNQEPSTSKPKKTVVNTVQKSSPVHVVQKVKDDHPLDLFFSSMAATVKQFSPYLQHMAKSKIFAVVTELERQHFIQQENQK